MQASEVPGDYDDESENYSIEPRSDVKPSSWRRRAEDVLAWLLMPLFFACLFAVCDILVMVARRAWTGSWSFFSLSDAIAMVGGHLDHKVGKWPLSVTVLLVALAIVGALTDSGQPTPAKATPAKDRKPMRLPRFVWPQTPHAETTVLIRLGRTLHWFTVVLAAGALAIAVIIGWDSVQQAARTAEAARQWDVSHPDGRPREGPFYDERPYESEAFLGTALLCGIAAAFGIAVTGRGIRYILAGE